MILDNPVAARYTDAVRRFAVANVGYCHPRVTDAIRAQAGVMTHCPSAAPSAAETDRPEEFVINQSTHGLLGNVQNLRGFGDGIEWLQLLHGVSSLMPVLLRFR